MYAMLLSLPLLLAACGNDETIDNDPATIPTEVLAPLTKTTARLALQVGTDKACYAPGQTVTFTASGDLPAGVRVRYRHGSDVVADEPLSSTTWTWTAPATDFTGYMVDLYTRDGSDAETLYATIGVDVSSDWARFPRYGFVATYDDTKTPVVIAGELAWLNRCHINGLQFYDWQYKHHWPLGGDDGGLFDVYKDIANRDVYTRVVKDYITQCHGLGMKAMFYNLCYGVLKDAAADGVSYKWHLFKDNNHANMDKLSLASSWKSDIWLVNPADRDWQAYLAGRNDEVYKALDFDGFHIDQVGDRGDVYDYYGGKVNLGNGFASFIKAMKTRHPGKRLVMNAVSNFGSKSIVGTGDVDFMYSELWGHEDRFSDLLTILKNNRAYAGSPSMGQVYAAYMNYNHKGDRFNTPGVLLTDAVMFALGASHLELGDHILCHEYFPNDQMKMTDQLRSALVSYYDFLTAYQNLLREGGTELVADLASGQAGVTVNAWPPKLGSVTTYAKTVGGKQVVSLLNFVRANSLSWRDMDGTQPEPETFVNVPLRLKAPGAKKVWVASPDSLGGAPQELTFRQQGDYVVFTLPSLKYWTMVVVE